MMRANLFKNFSWMMAEKIISIFGLIFVTSFVAKYIGPSVFGVIALSSSIFFIVRDISQFGSDSILFKRITQNNKSGIRLMLSVKTLRSFVYIALSLLIIAFFYIEYNYLTFYFVLATSIAYFFMTQDVYSIYYDAMLNSKINVICNLVGLTIALGIRFVVAYLHLDVVMLTIPIVLTTLIPYLIRKTFFSITEKHEIKNINFDMRYVKRYTFYMVKVGFPLAISSVSISVYTRLSQIFLAKFSSTSDLGIFSAASTLATSWTFITGALVTSYFTVIYKQKTEFDSMKLTAKLNGLILIVSIFIVLGIILTGKYVVSILYGSAYSKAYGIMIVLSLGATLSALGPVAYRYIIKESGYYFLSCKMFAVFFINVPISYLLVRFYGLWGAALTTLITEFLSLTLLNYFFKNRVILKMHLETFKLRNYI